MRADLIEVVQHRRDGATLAVPAFDQEKEVLTGSPIDRGEWLVEQDQLRILDDQPGEEDTLELASGQRLDRPALEPVKADGGERLMRRRAHCAGRGSRPADLPPMPEQHGVDDGDWKPPFDLGVLRRISDPAVAGSARSITPGCRPHLADDSLQQRTLSGAIWTDDGGQ